MRSQWRARQSVWSGACSGLQQRCHVNGALRGVPRGPSAVVAGSRCPLEQTTSSPLGEHSAAGASSRPNAKRATNMRNFRGKSVWLAAIGLGLMGCEGVDLEGIAENAKAQLREQGYLPACAPDQTDCEPSVSVGAGANSAVASG